MPQIYRGVEWTFPPSLSSFSFRMKLETFAKEKEFIKSRKYANGHIKIHADVHKSETSWIACLCFFWGIFLFIFAVCFFRYVSYFSFQSFLSTERHHKLKPAINWKEWRWNRRQGRKSREAKCWPSLFGTSFFFPFLNGLVYYGLRKVCKDICVTIIIKNGIWNHSNENKVKVK